MLLLISFCLQEHGIDSLGILLIFSNLCKKLLKQNSYFLTFIIKQFYILTLANLVQPITPILLRKLHFRYSAESTFILHLCKI
jgi:hypothetical protein